MIDNVNVDVPPWYRQFWPWFLITLPASVVVAGLYTFFLAIKYSDTLVSDNYYRDGLAINQVLTQDYRAQQMALSAQIAFQKQEALSAVLVSLSLSGDIEPPDILTLLLQHPTDAGADLAISLMSVGDGKYRGQLSVMPDYRFYLRLVPGLLNSMEAQQALAWRLNGELDFGVASVVQLHALAAKAKQLDQ